MLSKRQFNELEQERRQERETELSLMLPSLEGYIDSCLRKGVNKIYFKDISNEYGLNKDYFFSKIKEKYAHGGWIVTFIIDRQLEGYYPSDYGTYYHDKWGIGGASYGIAYREKYIGFEFK